MLTLLVVLMMMLAVAGSTVPVMLGTMRGSSVGVAGGIFGGGSLDRLASLVILPDKRQWLASFTVHTSGAFKPVARICSVERKRPKRLCQGLTRTPLLKVAVREGRHL